MSRMSQIAAMDREIAELQELMGCANSSAEYEELEHDLNECYRQLDNLEAGIIR